jgi:hypothetical protein
VKFQCSPKSEHNEESSLDIRNSQHTRRQRRQEKAAETRRKGKKGKKCARSRRRKKLFKPFSRLDARGGEEGDENPSDFQHYFSPVGLVYGTRNYSASLGSDWRGGGGVKD